MSRVGNKPIVIPEGVTVNIENNIIKAKGPKGEASMPVPSPLSCEIKGKEFLVKRPNDERFAKKMHGSARAIIFNLINGVHTPFTKILEIQGVGYRASVAGRTLTLLMGFSHDVKMEIPEGLECSVEKNVTITITGCNKETVGQFAATIRKVRKPEPYKGKGIRYQGEHVRRKVGKKAGKAK